MRGSHVAKDNKVQLCRICNTPPPLTKPSPSEIRSAVPQVVLLCVASFASEHVRYPSLYRQHPNLNSLLGIETILLKS